VVELDQARWLFDNLYTLRHWSECAISAGCGERSALDRCVRQLRRASLFGAWHRCRGVAMKEIRAEPLLRSEMLWDLLIRLSGIALLVLPVIAYSTGEEYPHNAIATLVVAGIFWMMSDRTMINFRR
jgi:hypothetical protein